MNPFTLLLRAMQEQGPALGLFSVEHNVHELRRKNEKHEASITVNVPDETVKNLIGKAERRDVLVFVRIPHDVVERLKSPLILASGPNVAVPRLERVGAGKR